MSINSGPSEILICQKLWRLTQYSFARDVWARKKGGNSKYEFRQWCEVIEFIELARNDFDNINF